MDPWRQLAARFRHGDITPIELRRVARAVDALPDDLHHIFCQCRFEGLSFAEIGAGHQRRRGAAQGRRHHRPDQP
jgi:DNA-directed RNA polymerase specialized sigma24 family protein